MGGSATSSSSTTASPITTTGSTTTSASPTTNTESTTTTESPTTTTAEPGPECKEDEVPQKFQTLEKIKKVQFWEDCRDACNARADCDYFKYKDHNQLKKRICFLMKVQFSNKNNWHSGEQFCV